jgi:UDP-2,3-diacylglucosamine hydrolase
MEKVFFVSDVHISGPKDPRYKRFLSFIDYVIEQEADSLIILGDLFEFFYGSSSYIEKKYPALFRSFKSLYDAGIETYYLYGNHDFNFKLSTTHLLSGPNLVTVVGEKDTLFATHGDGLDPSDYQYRFLKSILRSNIFKIVSSLVPQAMLYKVAGFFSELSRKINHNKKVLGGRESFYKESAEREILTKGSFKYCVFAHTHVPQLYSYNTGDKTNHYINPGFFGNDSTYAVIDSGGVYIGVFSAKC